MSARKRTIALVLAIALVCSAAVAALSARADAADVYVTAAKTEASAATAAATSALTEFWGILDEYKVNPEAVEIRLLTQKTAKILDKIGTVRLVQDGDSSILLMPKIEEEEDGES